MNIYENWTEGRLRNAIEKFLGAAAYAEKHGIDTMGYLNTAVQMEAELRRRGLAL